jgi:DNA-binding winged helix-turn-helix (wHTH) protein/TolB-like protein
VDLTSGELWRDAEAVPVQDLPFRVLTALLEQPGVLVTRADLTARLWGPDTFVDATAGLNTAVAKLREALGDNADAPKYIETVPKRGYRFIGIIDGVDARSERSDVDQRARLKPSLLRSLVVRANFGEARQTTDANAARSTDGIRRRAVTWAAIAAVFGAILFAAFQLRADRGRVRVAVVLFDNETGRADLARLAQGLTDATVTELTADPRLAVIGNAAVLRTERPFRDIAKVRDAVQADYVVIGQVQTLDGATIVRAHLIHAADESHVWVDVAKMTVAGEAVLQQDVSRRIRSAIARALSRS